MHCVHNHSHTAIHQDLIFWTSIVGSMWNIVVETLNLQVGLQGS